jgi:hypothetical protein
MEINEQTNIQPEQYNQFLPKQKFNIPKSTIQKVKSTITSLNSGLVNEKNFNTSQSTPYSFVINPNNQTVIDLSQCYFNVAGTLKVSSEVAALNTQDVKFGNLFLASLFQQAQLSIGGCVVANNVMPGIDANMQAALKFDQYDLVNKTVSDREFMLNEIKPSLNPTHNLFKIEANKWELNYTANETKAFLRTPAALPEYANKVIVYNDAAGVVLTDGTVTLNGCKVITIWFDDVGNGSGAVYKCTAAAGNAAWSAITTARDLAALSTYIYGLNDSFSNVYNSVIPIFTSTNGASIPFRCKLYLSDLFNYTVDSLDYIYNREINITLQRGSTDYILANILSNGGSYKSVLNVEGITKFELVCFSYLLTDQAKQQLLSYYSKPIETLFGVQTMNLTPLYNSEANSEQNITLPLTVNYDTKCILLAFPKCSNALVPLSTPMSFDILKDIAGNAGNTVPTKLQASWFGSNSNSYNFAGLKYIRISNTSNSNIYTYDFNGTAIDAINVNTFDKSFDYQAVNNTSSTSILDYREAYAQYKQIRLLFGKDPDNGLSYYNYLKDYCVIPIDLTGSNIPPNTRIFVTFQFASWDNNYNPLCYGNVKNNPKLTTNLLAVFLGSDVLQYNPDGTCIVKHILTAGSNEKGVNLK